MNISYALKGQHSLRKLKECTVIVFLVIQRWCFSSAFHPRPTQCRNQNGTRLFLVIPTDFGFVSWTGLFNSLTGVAVVPVLLVFPKLFQPYGDNPSCRVSLLSSESLRR